MKHFTHLRGLCARGFGVDVDFGTVGVCERPVCFVFEAIFLCFTFQEKKNSTTDLLFPSIFNQDNSLCYSHTVHSNNNINSTIDSIDILFDLNTKNLHLISHWCDCFTGKWFGFSWKLLVGNSVLFSNIQRLFVKIYWLFFLLFGQHIEYTPQSRRLTRLSQLEKISTI